MFGEWMEKLMNEYIYWEVSGLERIVFFWEVYIVVVKKGFFKGLKKIDLFKI